MTVTPDRVHQLHDGIPPRWLWPLRSYRQVSLYTMQTDALDRFGTRLEQRFTKDQITGMMMRVGLTDIHFSDREPFWCATGIRR